LVLVPELAAVIVQVPTDENVTTPEVREHSPVALKVTGNPPVAVAVGVYVSPATGSAGTLDVNDTNRSALPIANVFVAWVEAIKFASPARVAVTTHESVASADPVNNTDPDNSHPVVTDAEVKPNDTAPEPDPPEAATVTDPPNRKSSEPETVNDACDAFAAAVVETDAGEKPAADAVTVNTADSPSAKPVTVTTPPDRDADASEPESSTTDGANVTASEYTSAFDTGTLKPPSVRVTDPNTGPGSTGGGAKRTITTPEPPSPPP
jgi:hypothetical protein